MVITERAALQRIDRKLSQDGYFVRVNRRWESGGPGNWDGLKFWVIDRDTNFPAEAFHDVEKYGRKLGVIEAFEEVEQ